uniref:Uncharacterized protein n=1 Tax=Quercus lobata TaxID=97700 RepID=A0A7N2KMP0_QUELO
MGTAANPVVEQPSSETTSDQVEALLEAARYDDLDDVVSLASSGVSLDSKDSLGRTENMIRSERASLSMKNSIYASKDILLHCKVSSTVFEVGVGDRVKLWTDQWCGDSPLKLTFSVVYGIASNKETSVVSSLEWLGIGEWRSWDVHFIWRPNDWEMGGVDEFIRTLGSNLPPTENGDRDNLRGRGMGFVDWCIMCCCNGETVDHLLLHCGKAYRLWSLVFRSFGISWVLPRSVVDTLFALHMAAANGHLDVVEYLINRGVDLNAINEEKNTPLHWACLNGHIEVVKKLILAGANVTELNSYERTPMDEAVSGGKMDVIDAINAAVAQLELTGVSVS